MSEPETKQPEAGLVSVGMDELYTEWFQCPKCEFKDIARHFTFCPSCGIQVRDGAAAAESENATHERVTAFAAAPCYAPLRWSAEKPKRAGWWWVKARGHAAQIREFEIELYPMCAEDHPIQPVGGPLSTEGWKWFAGPLPEPLRPLGVKPEHNDQAEAQP